MSNNQPDVTWTNAKVLDGPKAAWQAPVVSPKSGRIYVFNTHGFLYGGMRCHTNNDGRGNGRKVPEDRAARRPSWGKASPTVCSTP